MSVPTRYPRTCSARRSAAIHWRSLPTCSAGADLLIPSSRAARSRSGESVRAGRLAARRLHLLADRHRRRDPTTGVRTVSGAGVSWAGRPVNSPAGREDGRLLSPEGGRHMKIAILDDYQDTIRALRGFKKVADQDV